jgi:hypothetical protein
MRAVARNNVNAPRKNEQSDSLAGQSVLTGRGVEAVEISFARDAADEQRDEFIRLPVWWQKVP